MSSTLLTLLTGLGLSAFSLVATPLAARVTHRMNDPEAGFVPTTILGLLITGCVGVGAICMVIGLSRFGGLASWILIPGYFLALIVLGIVAWRTLGPDRHLHRPIAGVPAV